MSSGELFYERNHLSRLFVCSIWAYFPEPQDFLVRSTGILECSSHDKGIKVTSIKLIARSVAFGNC